VGGRIPDARESEGVEIGETVNGSHRCGRNRNPRNGGIAAALLRRGHDGFPVAGEHVVVRSAGAIGAGREDCDGI